MQLKFEFRNKNSRHIVVDVKTSLKLRCSKEYRTKISLEHHKIRVDEISDHENKRSQYDIHPCG